MPMSQEELNSMYKGIEESNAVFFNMSREEKRVQLAKDVLLQLQLGRLFPFSVYIGANDGTGAHPLGNNLDGDAELQAVLKSTPACSVCGIGALFVVAIDRLNALKIGEFVNGHSLKFGIQSYLEKHNLFSRQELHIIENFFEGCEYMGSKREKMRAIMNTIIKLKGDVVANSDLVDTASLPEAQV